MRSLEDTLAFQSSEVVARFHAETGLSPAKCDLIFTETKRWLWACARREKDFSNLANIPQALLISPELELIDEMWHCFLVFTKTYATFCQEYFGHFIHHTPLTQKQIETFEELRKKNPKEALKQRQRELKPQLEYLYDLLGPETIRLWYQDISKLVSQS